MWCSVYIVCPSVLSCSNLKLHRKLEVKNIFKQENVMLQLTFNPGLTLTGFRTTRPRSFDKAQPTKSKSLFNRNFADYFCRIHTFLAKLVISSQTFISLN